MIDRYIHFYNCNGKISGVVSVACNSTSTYHVLYGDKVKAFTSVDELMDSPFLEQPSMI